MISKLFRKLAERLAANGSIQETYIELYVRAMETLLAMIINGITVLLIGYVLAMWWHCLIILAAFVPLRSYAGGYHAKGFVSCYVESCALLTLVLLYLKFYLLKGSMVAGVWLLFLVSVVIIFSLAPLADENKPISDKEAAVFKRKTRIILSTECIIIAFLSAIRSAYVYSVMIAVVISAFALILYQARKYMLAGREQAGDEINSN